MDVRVMLEALRLDAEGTGTFRAHNMPGGDRDVVFGGQLLAQSIACAAAQQPGRSVKTVHSLFARGALVTQPLDVDVEEMHAGRSIGSVMVTFRQSGRLCARSLVLLSADEEDLVRHADRLTVGSTPSDPSALMQDLGDWQIRVVGGLDVLDPELVAPPELDVWVRFVGAPSDDPTACQALLSYATDGFLIGAAMLPHAGIGQAQAHVSISTGVISHTLTFHEPFDAGGWLLLSQRSPYAGRGRSYGRADVFTEGGLLVASYVQDAIVRRIPEGQSSSGSERTYF